MLNKTDNCYCAFCKQQRRVAQKKDANWTNVLASLLGALITQYAAFQSLDGRIVVFAAVFMILAQLFVRLRWRLSMPCPHCGFDPLLYKIDRKETVRRVQEHLNAVKSSGRYMVKTQNPFEHLAKRKNPDAGNGPRVPTQSKENLVSRRI